MANLSSEALAGRHIAYELPFNQSLFFLPSSSVVSKTKIIYKNTAATRVDSTTDELIYRQF
jgi:hypothetical protein